MPIVAHRGALRRRATSSSSGRRRRPRRRATELTVEVIGAPVVVGGALPRHRRRHRERDPHPGADARCGVEVRTADVIHSFWVPQLTGRWTRSRADQRVRALRRRRRALPRPVRRVLRAPARAHGRSYVVADAAGGFGRWLARPGDAGRAAGEAAAPGQRGLRRRRAPSCHTIRGTSATRRRRPGPHARRRAARRSRRATIPNTRADLRAWIVGRAGTSSPGTRCRTAGSRPRSSQASSPTSRACARWRSRRPRRRAAERIERLERSGRAARASSAGSRRPTTSASASATSTRRSCFFVAGGVEALVMRTQLAPPNNDARRRRAPTTSSSRCTASTMIFLFNIPMTTGVRQLPAPADDRRSRHGVPAAERASATGSSSAPGSSSTRASRSGTRPNGGWFAYVPLASRAYDAGRNIDFWGLGVIFVGISSTVRPRNFIVTIFKLRAPGMTFNRMPLFCLALLVSSFMLLFALPSLSADAILLFLDRNFGTHFFDVAPAARRSSASTSSGSWATPRCTS